MCFTDVGHNGHIRFSETNKIFHLTEFTDPHLDHSQFLTLFQTKQSQRHTDLAVLVPRRLHNPKAGFQRCTYHLFC